MDCEIVVLSALQQELDALLPEVDDRASLSGMVGWSGRLEGIPVVLAKASIGKVNAAITTTLMVERFHPRVVLLSGVAGALDPTLAAGDVVIATRSIQHDAGVLGPDGLRPYQAGHHPEFLPTDILGFEPTEELIGRVRSSLDGLVLEQWGRRSPRMVFGTVLTGDVFLQDTGLRDRLRDKYDALAIEMEGAAMAQTAETLGVDHLIIRTISDLAGGGAFRDFMKNLELAARNSAHIVRRVVPVV